MNRSVREGSPSGSAGDPAAALRSLLAAPVAAVSGRPITGRDLAAAGALSGRWAQLEDDLSRGLGALRGWSPTAAQLEAGLREFRYARRLVSAAEFTGWMRARGVTLAELRGAVSRRLAREREPEAPASDHETEPVEVLAALPAEAVYSGALRECAEWTIDRLLCAGLRGHAPAAKVDVDAGLESDVRTLAAGVVRETTEERRARISELLAADAAYEAHTRETCSPSVIAAHLRTHALDWLQFGMTGFASRAEGPAAEIAAQLREGAPPERMTQLSGVPAEATMLRLEDAPERMQGSLAAADPGAVLGPFQDGEVHRTWVVRTRAAAEPSDPEVVARACAEIVEEEMSRRRAGEVKWFERH